MRELSPLSDKLTESWLEFALSLEIEVTDVMLNLYRHRFFNIQKDYLLNGGSINTEALKELGDEIQRRYK